MNTNCNYNITSVTLKETSSEDPVPSRGQSLSKSQNNNSKSDTHDIIGSKDKSYKTRYIKFLVSTGYSIEDAQIVIECNFTRLKKIRENNPDKLKYLLKNQNIDDERIYKYLYKRRLYEYHKENVYNNLVHSYSR